MFIFSPISWWIVNCNSYHSSVYPAIDPHSTFNITFFGYTWFMQWQVDGQKPSSHGETRREAQREETINGTIDVAGRGRSRVTFSYTVRSLIVRLVEYTLHSVAWCLSRVVQNRFGSSQRPKWCISNQIWIVLSRWDRFRYVPTDFSSVVVVTTRE